MLAVINLIIHDIEVPQILNEDSLGREYTSIKQKDRVDIIVANPPFGGVVGDGMETNFPLNYRTKESADLFLILFIQMLKEGGRAGIVLPDGSLTGEGVKARVRQKLLEDCNDEDTNQERGFKTFHPRHNDEIAVPKKGRDRLVPFALTT